MSEDRGVTQQAVQSVVDLAERLTHVSEPWQPHVVAALNDYEVKVVRLLGDFAWHRHTDTDELFLVLSGSLRIELRGEVGGEVGEEGRPVAAGEVTAVLIEPRGVVNTGDADGALTASHRCLV